MWHTKIVTDSTHVGVVTVAGGGVAGAITGGEEGGGVVSDKGK